MSNGLITRRGAGPATFTFQDAAAPAGSGQQATNPITTSGSYPALPKYQVDVTFPAIARTVTVKASGGTYSDLQTAITTEATNNPTINVLILVDVGLTFSAISLPNKAGTGWIVICSANASTTPGVSPLPSGVRVQPSDAANMPVIEISNSSTAISTQTTAHHYRFVGFEIRLASAYNNVNYGLVTLGSNTETTYATQSHHIIFDRCYIHGNDNTNTECSRGVSLGSAWGAVIDCYISQIISHGNAISDCQAIAIFSGAGPFLIDNNYLEGMTENLMVGGANPAIIGLNPSDITITRNHFYKPPAWYSATPHSYVKNLMEFKAGVRILVEGNVFENNWTGADQGGQCFQIHSTPSGGTTGGLWELVNDITIRYNIIRNSDSGPTIAASGNSYGGDPRTPTMRLSMHDNLLQNVGGKPYNSNSEGRIFCLYNGSTCQVDGIRVYHNTAVSYPNQANTQMGVALDAGSAPATNIEFRDNIVTLGVYGYWRNGAGSGSGVWTAFCATPPAHNALIGSTNGNTYSTANGDTVVADITGIGFTDYAGGDYSLAVGSAFKAGGAHQASDGTDVGANITLLNQKTAGVVQVHT